MTPLHISSKKGINDVVGLLLKKGADLHAKDQVVTIFSFIVMMDTLKNKQKD